MEEFYGWNYYWHPQYAETQAYYDLVLRSLHQTGDLLGDSTAGYTFGPQGLTTLDRYEEDAARHADQRRNQYATHFLAAAVVLVSLLQAGVAIWAEGNPDPPSVPSVQTTKPAPEVNGSGL